MTESFRKDQMFSNHALKNSFNFYFICFKIFFSNYQEDNVIKLLVALFKGISNNYFNQFRLNHDACQNPIICQLLYFKQNLYFDFARKEQFERRFIALFDSPGPAVLKFTRGLESYSTGFLHLLKYMWKLILICLLHATLAGMGIWLLVCTYKFDTLRHRIFLSKPDRDFFTF